MENKEIDGVVRIFTDGSISSIGSEFGIGSYTATILLPARQDPVVVFGSCSHTTISRMEILAINEGLHHLVSLVQDAGLLPGMLQVEVYTDSQYCRDVMCGEKQRIKNTDLFKAFDVLGARFGSLTINKIPRNSEPLQANSDHVAGVCRVAIQNAMKAVKEEIKTKENECQPLKDA
jgi:ribonuclease HI